MSLDQSEAERRAAQPPGDQAETAGKRTSALAASQRDKEKREAVVSSADGAERRRAE